MRKPLMVTAALLLMLLTACVWISGCDDEKASAEDLLAETGRKYTAADSYSTRVDATVEVSGDASAFDPDFDAMLPINLGFGSQLDFDASDRDSIKLRIYDMSVDGLTDMIRKAGEASGDSDMGAIMGAGMYSQMLSGMEIVVIKDVIYLQMSGAWFDFKLSDLPVSEGADFSKADLNCLIATTIENQNTWDSEGGLTDIQELDEEEIDGVKTRHLRASIDPEAVGDEPDVTSAIEDKCGFGDIAESARDDAYEEDDAEDDQTGTGTVGGQDAEDQKDEAEEKAFIESITKNAKIDYWIDTDSNLRQQRLEIEIGFGDIARIIDEEEDAEGLKDVVMKISMTMKMSGYGESMDIIAPDDTTSLKRFFDEMSGPGMGMGIGGNRTEQV